MRSPMAYRVVALAVLIVGSAAPALAGSYVYATITHPGETGSQTITVNNRGVAVGLFSVAGSTTTQYFAWSNGASSALPGDITFTRSLNDHNVIAGYIGTTNSVTVLLHVFSKKRSTIPMKAGYYSFPTGIDDASTVIGLASTPDQSVQVGFASQGKTTTYLQPPGGENNSIATLISPSGTVYGTYIDKAANIFFYSFANGIYSNFTVPGTLEAVSNEGYLAGRYPKTVNGDTIFYGYVQRNGHIQSYLYPGTTYSDIFGFAPKGALIGTYEDASNAIGFFVTVGGAYYKLTYPGATLTWVNGVSSTTGALAGFYLDSANVEHAFVATCPVAERPCTHL